jgi:hypothetical protein
MSIANLEATAAAIAKRKRIDADDVLALRRCTFGDGLVSRHEADALFHLDGSTTEKCAEWTSFFLEVMVDYVVHQEKPAGYVSAENGRWLVEHIARDGFVRGDTELELLVRVLERSMRSPESLVAFALKQVALAVAGDADEPAAIDEREVELVRRILFAFGGDGHTAVTRAEAEALVEINDTTDEHLNHPAWNDLFVKAIANFVLCATGYAPPSREEALRRDTFFETASVDIGGFFNRMVSGGVRAIIDAYALETDLEQDWEERNRRAEAAARRAGRVSEHEARWLAERIGGGNLRDNERALLAFLQEAVPAAHPDFASPTKKIA